MMISLPRAGSRHGGGQAGNLLMKKRLQVTHSRLCACSTGVTTSGHSEVSSVETRFFQSDNTGSTLVSGKDRVYCAHRAIGESLALLFSNATNYGQVISIPSCVHEICDKCFCGSKSSRCVTFGVSSKLERIGAEAFRKTCVEFLSLPDSVVELCDKCFYECQSLRRVIFGASSNLVRICAEAFCKTSVDSIVIPDSVVALSEKCFYQCNSLRCVQFGVSSNLEQIGSLCFAGSRLMSFEIPSSVVTIGGGIVSNCDISCVNVCCKGFVVCDGLLMNMALTGCHGSVQKIIEIVIPYNVVELSDNCFYKCKSLRSVTFCTSANEPCWRRFYCCGAGFLHLQHHPDLSALVLVHSVERVLSQSPFQTASLSSVIAAFVGVVVFGVLHLGQDPSLSELVLRHSLRQVLNHYLFRTVLLNCVINAFFAARVFSGLNLGQDRSSLVLGVRHSVILVLSLCLFQTLLWYCCMTAFMGARIFDVLRLGEDPSLCALMFMHSVVRILCPCLFQTMLLN